LLPETQQVVHGIGQPAGVVERQPLVLVLLRERDQYPGNSGAAAYAAITGGDAGDVRGMRAFRALRLRLDVGGRQAKTRRGGDRAVEIDLLELGAVLELLVEEGVAVVRRGARVTALIPDAHEARLPGLVKEVRVAEVEALDVDQTDENL